MCPRILIDFVSSALSCCCSPPEGVSVCLSVCLSVVLHPVHTLPSKSGPVFSSYPDMQRGPHVHTKNRVPLSSGHLAWTISGGLARSKRDFHSEASTYLSYNDRLTTSMLYLVTLSPLHLFFYTFVHLTYSCLLHPVCLGPWGVSFTLYMPRQLHSAPLCAQIYGHRWEGGVYCSRWGCKTAIANRSPRKTLLVVRGWQ